MSSSKKPKIPKSDNNSSLKNDLSPAEKDAKMVRRWYPLSWLIKLLTFLLFIFVTVFLIMAYMVGTDDGTKFVIEKIINKTGVSLDYGKGNLRDGLSVSDIYWSDDTTTVTIDKSYIKIGWRAILNEEVHLRDADINNILIIDSSKPSNKPFSYTDIDLPYNIHLNHANIDSIVYQKTGLDDLVFKDIDAKKLRWKGTRLDIGKGDFKYSDIIDIKNLHGSIDFTDDYPLDADVNVTIKGLDKAYFGSLDIEANGSLKQIHGKIKSVYNDKYKVSGELDAEPLKDGVPFSALLKWDQAKIPYASQHDIWLKSSKVKAEGTYENVHLIVDSMLEAKGVPNGKYHAEGKVDVFDGELDVSNLTVNNKKGQLTGKGIFNWAETFFMDVNVSSKNYNLSGIIPKQYDEYIQYQGYLPKKLNGNIDFNLTNENAEGNFYINTKLSQRGKETVQAEIIELNNHSNTPNSWQIKASWQDFYRKIDPKLDEHLLGIIDSKAGTANILITDKQLNASVNAQVTQVSVAPKGRYKVKLNVTDNSRAQTVDITSLSYQGDVGNFSGISQVVMPKKTKDIVWKIDGIADQLKPYTYHNSIPITSLNGKIKVNGTVGLDTHKNPLTRKTKNIQKHSINVKQSDVSMLMTNDYDKRNISMKGDGSVKFTLGTDDLILQDEFKANFDGQLKTADMPTGKFKILVNGKPNKKGNIHNFDFEKISYSGNQGQLHAKGKLGLKDSIKWDFQADLEKFNMGFFVPDNPAIITGKLDTNGQYFSEVISTESSAKSITSENIPAKSISSNTSKSKNTVNQAIFKDFSVKFNGKAETAKLPSGTMQIDISGVDTNQILVNKLIHKGEAGSIDLTGNLNLKDGYDWTLKGKLNNFNMGYISADLPTNITGNIDSNGKWQSKHETLEDFVFRFDGNVQTSSLPSGRLVIDATTNSSTSKTNEITITQLKHKSDAGLISAKGTVSIKDGFTWQLDTEMQKFNFGYLNKNIPSSLSGTLNILGNWSNEHQLIDIKAMDLIGTLKKKDFKAKGKVLANLHLPKNLDDLDIKNFTQTTRNNKNNNKNNELIDELNVNNFSIHWGDNFLTVEGNKQNLKTKIDVHNLDELYKELKGKVTGSINIETKSESELPTITVDLTAKKISLPKIQLSHGRIKGEFKKIGQDVSELRFEAKKLKFNNDAFNNVNILLSGTQNQHDIDVAFTKNQISFSGLLRGGLKLNKMLDTANTLTNKKWSGELIDGNVKTNKFELSQTNPAKIIIDTNTNNMELNLESHCWQANDKSQNKNNIQSQLCLQDKLIISKNVGNINLALQNIDTSLIAMAIPKEVDWKAKVSGKTKIKWQQGGKPVIHATLFSDNGKIGLVQEDSSRTFMPYRRISLMALSTPKGLKVRTDIKSRAKSQGYAEVIINPYVEGKPIKGDLVLDKLNLAMFKPFFPGMRILEGEGSITGKVDGSIQKPLIYGDVTLKNGRMSMLGLPINLSNVNATAKISGAHANLKGIFNSGSGKGTLNGSIDWQGDVKTKLSITGKELEIAQPPLISAKINPDINIIVKPKQNYMEITGAISIPTATFRPPEANEDIVTKSRDVDVLDRRTLDNIDEVLAITEPWSINANIGVDLGTDVKFRGFGAELPMAGAIVISQSGQNDIKSKGVIQVSRSSDVDVFGQSLELKYAQIRFDGKLQEPNISINAAKIIGNTTVGLRVKGNVVEPKIIVYNDSGLSEQQAMNALITGRLNNEVANQVSEEGFRSEVTNNLAAAGLSIGLNPTRSWTNNIGRAVGLQALSLSANASGSRDDTNVNVTGYITPDLYIRYGFGVFNAQSELSFRYQLTRRLYVEASSSTEKFVDLVYGWQF